MPEQIYILGRPCFALIHPNEQFAVAPIVCVKSLFCFAIVCVLSSFAIIWLGKRELVALLLLCSECHVAVIVI